MAEIATRPQIRRVTQADVKPQSLTRNISTFTAITFALACVGLASSGTLALFTFQGLWPGVNLAIVLGVGIVLSLIHGYTYSMMGVLAPRSGADYVISSRVLGAPISFAASWGVMIIGAFLAGSALAFLSESLLPGLLINIAMVTQSNGMIAIANTLAHPDTIVLIGSILVVAVFGLAILPPHFTQTLTKIGFFAGITAWLIMLAQLAFPSRPFSTGWDQLMGAQSYGERMNLASISGMQIQPQADWLIYGGILIGFSIFFGNWISTYLAGEVKKPERTLLVSSWSSTLIAAVFFVGSAILIQRLAPAEWFSAESFLRQTEEFSGLSMPWIFFYANVVSPNIAAAGFILFAFTLLIINLVQMQYLYSSRILMAWVDDEMMPAPVGIVHTSLKAPIVAILIVAIISLFSLLVSGLTGAVENPLEYMFLLAVFQLPPALAITLLPFVRPNWFESAPGIARIKIGPIPLVSITGLVTFIFLLAVAVISIVTTIGNGVGIVVVAIFVAIVASGLGWFYYFRKYQRDRNIMVDENFKTLINE